MDMENLTQDALIAILSFVPTDDLLEHALGVCRRWRAAALDPYVWRHRTLSPDEYWYHIPMALRLAPCLHHLELNELEVIGTVLAYTRCAVRSLDLTIRTNIDAFLGALAIRRQGKLRRLRSLALHDTLDGEDPRLGFIELMTEMYRVKNLRDLCVDWGVLPHTLGAVQLPSTPPPPSIRYLNWVSLPGLHLDYLIQSHASTLVVLFLSYKVGHIVHTTVELPNLMTLSCSFLRNVHLLRCPQLRCFIFYGDILAVSAEHTQITAGHAETFLQRAHNLEILQLEEWLSDSPHLPRFVDALGSLPNPQLRSLLLTFEAAHYLPDLQLSRLRNLEKIDFHVCTFSDDDYEDLNMIDPLFDAIIAENIPKLKVLRSVRVACYLHDFVHDSSLLSVVLRYPELHILGEVKCCPNVACLFCGVRRCISMEKGPDDWYGFLAICGHRDGVFGCSRTDDHRKDSEYWPWLRVPRFDDDEVDEDR